MKKRVVKDRGTLMAYLCDECGYKGEKTLHAVKSFCDTEGLEDEGLDDATVSKLWAKKTVRIAIETDGEDVSVSQAGGGDGAASKAEDEDDDDDEDEGKKALATIIKAMRATAGEGAGPGVITGVRDRIEDDPNFGYRPMGKGGLGQFLMDVKDAATTRRVPDRLSKAHAAYTSVRAKAFGVKAAGLNEAIDHEGGFLVNEQFANELLKKAHETGQVLSRVRTMPMGAKQISLPAVKEDSRADGSRNGGVRGYWEGEGATRTESQAEFSRVKMTAHKLTVTTSITDELAEDSAVTIEPLISDLASEEIKFKLENAFIRGTGAGQPKGILNAAALVTISEETSQPSDTFYAENALKMWGRLHARSRDNAVWFINQDVEQALYQMSLAVGSAGGQVVYMPPGGLSERPYATLMGRPVIPIEYCSTLGDVGDVILADMSQYLYGQRKDITGASSMHVRFLTDEMVFKWTLRGDGQSWWPAALTPFQGANTQSPFVVVETR